ncbi:hypothetical protein KAT36_03755 [Candidatus Pacearchaeota archaeon]|nr:hypothetical protein [Candidatus Pacearchaeota archaeon]
MKSSVSNKSAKILSSRAQVGIEFIIIVGAVLFFASILLLAIQQNHQSKIYQYQNVQLKEIALTVQNEINLALESSEGYSRQFEIPETSGALEYEITIDSGIVYVKTTNDKHALALPVPEVIGNINKTQNKIEKINGVIYLNQ